MGLHYGRVKCPGQLVTGILQTWAQALDVQHASQAQMALWGQQPSCVWMPRDKPGRAPSAERLSYTCREPPTEQSLVTDKHACGDLTQPGANLTKEQGGRQLVCFKGCRLHGKVLELWHVMHTQAGKQQSLSVGAHLHGQVPELRLVMASHEQLRAQNAVASLLDADVKAVAVPELGDCQVDDPPVDLQEINSRHQDWPRPLHAMSGLKSKAA